MVAYLRARRLDPAAYRYRPSREVVRTCADGMRAIYHRGIYHASIGLLDADEPPNPRMPLHCTPDTDGTIYKRLETGMLCDARLARVAGWTHTPGTGPYKHGAIKLVTHPVRRVRFYTRADRRVLEGLLEGLSALGKKTSIGYGQIESWEIAPVTEDRSVVWNGRAMRSIPCKMLDEYELPEMYVWRPPYWNGRDIVPCAPPGARVKLKPGSQLRRIRNGVQSR